MSENIAHSDTPSCIKTKHGVNANHTRQYIWMVEENSDTLINCLRYKSGFDVPSGKGTCLIVCALGGKKGFVEKTNLRFVGNSKSKDYHRDINSAHFKEWLTQKMLPNIGDKTVIVTNNAPCRSKQTEESKKPNTSWEKKKMQD